MYNHQCVKGGNTPHSSGGYRQQRVWGLLFFMGVASVNKKMISSWMFQSGLIMELDDVIFPLLSKVWIYQGWHKPICLN